MARKMTMAAYEKSGADRKADMAGAKKAGVSLAKYENSKADEKKDRAAVKKINRKK